jgi:SAM-dependent methyltransferase
MRKESQPHAHVKAQVDGVDRYLQLETRSRVLDLGCGEGRRALELARRGHRVLGADPDEHALAGARAAAKAERLNAHFVCADPRAIPYRAEFDAIVFLDDAFGRLPTDRDDLRALEAARRALKLGAKLLLDTVNREWVVRHLELNVFDFEKGRLEDRRVYALTELLALADKAGLACRGYWGGFGGEAYGMDSPRLVALFEPRRDLRPVRKVETGVSTAIRIKGRR